jgi:hypothetical protein
MADTPGTLANGGAPTDAILLAIVDLLKTGSNPDILDAQRILLQRIALEGDVVQSRLPAPRNVTEIGGYLNLLQDTGQPELRGQMLAALLGVAGPPQSGLLNSGGGVTPLAFVQLANDRPAGVAQPAMPTSITIRSDFLDAFQVARNGIHSAGASLPLLSPPRVLPHSQPGSVTPPDDLLPFLGRALDVVPSALLSDPDNDPLAIARLATAPAGAFQLVARELDGGTLVPEQSWSAQKCDATSCTAIPATQRRYFALAPILATAGWYPLTPLVLPSSKTKPGSSSRLLNLTGLVAGTTRLGDELALLYPPEQIASSTLVTRLNLIWNGQAFA